MFKMVNVHLRFLIRIQAVGWEHIYLSVCYYISHRIFFIIPSQFMKNYPEGFDEIEDVKGSSQSSQKMSSSCKQYI